MKDPIKGFLYSLAGVILVSTNFVTAKFGLAGFNPETFSLVWTGFATIYSILICLIFKESRKELLSPNHIRPLIALGIATGTTMLLAWNGLSLLDPVFASLMWRFFPVMTIIAGVLFLKERLTAQELIAMSIMLFGSIYSIKGRWNIVGKGVILTLLAACSGTVQFLIAKSYSKKIDTNVMVAYRVGIAFLFILAWATVSNSINFHVPLRYWLVTMLGAFLGPCASFLFTFRSYRYWELSKSSILLTLQPIFVLPMAYIFLHTLPEKREIIGGVIILSGAFYLALIQARR